ncbi:hypothetical protein [Actinospongicola halichondriae]|uniref:hypothetical protein n=1 Tax=Actinospongicola halichondriae TaxID=3236844 RepID=UPI003D44F14F
MASTDRKSDDRRFDAIVFDFSGVMVSSAFTAIGSAAADHDMDEDAFIEFLLGPYAEDTDHAWHKAERGEIGIMDWITDTMSRAEADGLGLDLGFMASMLGELEVYDVMVEAARARCAPTATRRRCSPTTSPRAATRGARCSRSTRSSTTSSTAPRSACASPTP